MNSSAACRSRNFVAVAVATVLLLVASGCSVAELGLSNEGTDQPPASLAAAESSTGADGESPDNQSESQEPESQEPESLNGGPSDDPSAPAGPRLAVDPDTVFLPGTCYQPPFPGAGAEEVPCEDPHLIEIFATRLLPGDRDAPWPSVAAAARLCDEDFSAIVGVALGLATIFEGSIIRPSQETWEAGERDVTCYVVYPEPTTQPLLLIDPLRSFDRVSLYGLQAGDCLIDFSTVETSFELVECDLPHDAEVFARFDFPAGTFPGADVIDPVAEDLCFGQGFADFVGVAYPTSEIQSLRASPSAETWALGHHHVACILTDELVRVGSFAGASR